MKKILVLMALLCVGMTYGNKPSQEIEQILRNGPYADCKVQVAKLKEILNDMR